jgi:hypothetical protein
VAVYAASIRSDSHAPTGVETSAKLTLVLDYSVGLISKLRPLTYAEGVQKSVRQ